MLINYYPKNKILLGNKWAVYKAVTPSVPNKTNNSTPTKARATIKVRATKKKKTNKTPRPLTSTSTT